MGKCKEHQKFYWNDEHFIQSFNYILLFLHYSEVTPHYYLSLTRKLIWNLIGWEKYNIGRICTVFNICTLWLNKKKNTFEFHSGKIEIYSLKTN